MLARSPRIPGFRASPWVCGVTPALHAQLLSVPLVFWAVSELTLPMSYSVLSWTHRIVCVSAVLHSFFRGSETIFRRSTPRQVPPHAAHGMLRVLPAGWLPTVRFTTAEAFSVDLAMVAVGQVHLPPML